MVPTVGLEPTRPFEPYTLNVGSLPIPSRGRIKKRGLQLIRICLLPPTPRHLGGHLTGSVARRSTFFIFRIPLMVPMVRLELTHPFGYQILSLGCLPVPSQRHIKPEYVCNQ